MIITNSKDQWKITLSILLISHAILFPPMTKLFQSYLIIDPDKSSLRQKTVALAQKFGIDLTLVSPDIFIIAPLKNTLQIDQIRGLKSHIFQKPVKNPYKFIILEDAHKATIETQNALLKILEEPPPRAIIVLEAQLRENLLPTITSRVVTISSLNEITPSESQFYFFENQNFYQTLLEVSQVKNHGEWLDHQIVRLYSLFFQNLKSGKNPSLYSQLIQKCLETKKFIQANVNPKFALFNLVISTR